jgi:hypothetical protein
MTQVAYFCVRFAIVCHRNLCHKSIRQVRLWQRVPCGQADRPWWCAAINEPELPAPDGVTAGLAGCEVLGSVVGDGDWDGDVVGDCVGDPDVADGDGELVVGDGDTDGLGLAVGDAVGVGQAEAELPGKCGRAVGSPVGGGLPGA